MTAHRARRFVVVLLASAAVAACSKGSSSSSTTGRSTRAAGRNLTDDSAGGTVDLATTSYKAAPLSAIGSVSGTIKIAGTPPPDTVSVTRDSAVCGKTAPGLALTAKNGGVANAVVWIADIATGKALPNDKREDLTIEHCELDPRVQAMVVGSTVDVENEDKLIHKFVFTRAGTHDTLTQMPFFNVAQLVASERLAKEPGIVEIRCAVHPWTRGYIAVFDQPYFAVTDDNGSFKIDSLPPGQYKMMVWHQGMAKPLEQQVQVAAGGSGKVDLAIDLSK